MSFPRLATEIAQKFWIVGKVQVYLPSESAAIAQLVERFTRNEEVAGSSPACGSTQSRSFELKLLLFLCFLGLVAL